MYSKSDSPSFLGWILHKPIIEVDIALTATPATAQPTYQRQVNQAVSTFSPSPLSEDTDDEPAQTGIVVHEIDISPVV